MVSIDSGAMKGFTLSMIVVACMVVTSCGDRGIPMQAVESESPSSEVVVQSPEAVQSSPAPKVQPRGALVASLPEHEVYMYGEESVGVTLQVGDRSRHFDWVYMTPRQIEPVMEVNDYDGDGEDELSIVLYVGSGTGISIEELHIIELNEATLEDHVFDNSVEQVSSKVSFNVEMDNGGIPTGEIRIDSDVYPIEFPLYNEEEQGKIYEQLIFGSIIGFYTVEGQLKARFGAGVHYEQWVMPEYIGDIIADVTYEGGAFRMSNYTFEPDVSITN